MSQDINTFAKLITKGFYFIDINATQNSSIPYHLNPPSEENITQYNLKYQSADDMTETKLEVWVIPKKEY